MWLHNKSGNLIMWARVPPELGCISDTPTLMSFTSDLFMSLAAIAALPHGDLFNRIVWRIV